MVAIRILLIVVLVLWFAPAADAHHKPCHRTACPTPTPTVTPTPTTTPTPSPSPSPTPTPTPTPTVLFQDDFNGTVLNPVWTTYPYAPTGTTAGTGRAYLDGAGHLKLEVQDSTQSAAIWTRDTYRVAPPFTAKAWVRFPASYNIWNAFWLNNGAGEIDVYENGGLTDRYQASAHQWSGSVDINSQVVPCLIDFNPQAAFHSYEARVTSTSVTYLFDGRVCTTLTVNAAAFSPAMWLNLDNWPANGWTQSGYPSALTVDRVEVTG